ncbi:MAG: TetR family transcriptional regulator C-terminal domain-containing protein [Woeseiaceae bacterium]|nr:TetR family transcriptional regulator C-terminal domain-containing protein [Woeseiaceae bacterium]
MHTTKKRLLDAGLELLLEHGYNDLGVQRLLREAGVPKGSFYHHFDSKQDFALQVIDRYMVDVHAGLDACLNDDTRPPLGRVRHFFELTLEKYREEGYLGCLLGGLGQELSAIDEQFRRRIESCLGAIAQQVSECLDQAKQRGDLPETADTRQLADLLVDCWEGAALRSRLWRDPRPLQTVLDFYFSSVAGQARA